MSLSTRSMFDAGCVANQRGLDAIGELVHWHTMNGEIGKKIAAKKASAALQSWQLLGCVTGTQ